MANLSNVFDSVFSINILGSLVSKKKSLKADVKKEELSNLKSSDVELVITPSDNCPAFNEMNFTVPTPAPQPSTACPVNALNVDALKTFTSNQTQWYLEFAGAWKVLTEFSYPEGSLKDVVMV